MSNSKTRPNLPWYTCGFIISLLFCRLPRSSLKQWFNSGWLFRLLSERCLWNRKAVNPRYATEKYMCILCLLDFKIIIQLSKQNTLHLGNCSNLSNLKTQISYDLCTNHNTQSRVKDYSTVDIIHMNICIYLKCIILCIPNILHIMFLHIVIIGFTCKLYINTYIYNPFQIFYNIIIVTANQSNGVKT